ncbi:Na+/H+ antiporter [Candidatus Leptofilum sp.]|uniref:Na+/H+ antiporter n=1 Tax=Candidatus Leptofilum sp. TaxID=3241576 RepID=UPI003B59E1B9
MDTVVLTEQLPKLLFAEDGGGLVQQELSFMVLLFIAAMVAIVVRRIRLPYTVALVLVGLVLSFFPNFLGFTVSSDLILAILVPPLIFEATLHIPWRKLKRDLLPVLLLAVGGTLVGTFLVGGLVVQFLGISWAAALAFGALISATDPVAVIAFFRTLGVNKRLTILVEGESLFNDGVAIVIFNLALAAGTLSGSFGLGEALQEFFIVAFGGLAVGLVMGYVVSYIILKNVDDHLIETATTVALAFGSFVVAESFGQFIGVDELHFSGILAVVAAGLMVGNIGLENTSPTTKLTLDNFWEFLSFVVNSLVFLLIGLEIELAQLQPNIIPILVAVMAIILSRGLIIYVFSWIYGRFQPRNRIPLNFQHVMYWGGLRGAISLALALSIENAVFGSDVALELRVMTFGVVLFTLLVQGMTIEKLISRLKLADKPPQRVELQRRQATLFAKWAGKHELDRLRENGILFKDIWDSMGQVYDEEILDKKEDLRTHLQDFPELEQEMYLQAREDALNAERSAIGEAARRGLISNEVHDELIIELNNRVAALELIKKNRGLDVENKEVHHG